MTIQRGPRRPWLRRLTALVLAAAIVYAAAVTASSSDAASALAALGQQGELALNLLRAQLGDSREGALPAAAALAIGQSPMLLSGREAVLELRRTEESDEPAPPEEEPDAGQTVPVPERPDLPETPLVFADNGVTARTLVPASPDGYIVTGDVYISNRSSRDLDAGIFDGTFAAALPEEEGPQVLIVHTHGSEAYTMPPGEEYESSGDCRTTDDNYNVVRVGNEIAAALESAGLTVLHDATLHDYPEYSGAYNRSLKSVEDYLEEYPTISFVLDVHRDAVSDADGTMYKVVSNVHGVNAAQLSFIIGTDGGGLEHPDWKENLKLAAAIQQRLTDDFPTLMRPITVRDSRYNQHTTLGSLLIEVGAAGNSLDEALLSARLFGAAMAEVIQNK